jgi:O-antigen/teichoic acid export membrane protein
VEFGKHIGKGIWGIAGKALPVIYGFGYVLLVIRVLPEEEFGTFVLIQEVFLVITGLATAFALQPLLKFAAEERDDTAGVITVSLVLQAAFLVPVSLLVVALRPLAVTLFNAGSLGAVWNYIPAMLAASFARNFSLIVLQSRFRVREVFWVDAAHFLGAPLLVWVLSRLHEFDTAEDLIIINLLSLSGSSLLGLWLSRRLVRITAHPRREDYRQMWDYGKYSLGGVASYLVYSKADTFILAGFTGPVQVAVYNSVKVFTRVFEMVGQVVQMFLLPAASMLSSRGEQHLLRAVVEKAILFLTVALLPVSAVFMLTPSLVLQILYEGRYAEAAPLLQIFGLLSFVVPLYAVCSNTLMGLGKAREGFLLGLAMLVLSLITYFAFIPLLASPGAAMGYVLASYLLGWLSARVTVVHVPFTAAGVMGRFKDIKVFLTTHARRLFSR